MWDLNWCEVIKRDSTQLEWSCDVIKRSGTGLNRLWRHQTGLDSSSAARTLFCLARCEKIFLLSNCFFILDLLCSLLFHRQQPHHHKHNMHHLLSTQPIILLSRRFMHFRSKYYSQYNQQVNATRISLRYMLYVYYCFDCSNNKKIFAFLIITSLRSHSLSLIIISFHLQTKRYDSFLHICLFDSNKIINNNNNN
jgi:hypothetical protein